MSSHCWKQRKTTLEARAIAMEPGGQCAAERSLVGCYTESILVEDRQSREGRNVLTKQHGARVFHRFEYPSVRGYLEEHPSR